MISNLRCSWSNLFSITTDITLEVCFIVNGMYDFTKTPRSAVFVSFERADIKAIAQ
jgi:hypothetical protein